MLETNYEQLKQGSYSAFTYIYTRYNKKIYWIGKGFLRNNFVIESLVQDTFLKLWTHRDMIESPDHIFFFLRFVMKRECISYYTRPKNKFHRKIYSLDEYENYQDYMLGFDPENEKNDSQDHGMQQEQFNQVMKVLPLLGQNKKRLIELCLKYGFQYKAIGQAMGTSTNIANNETKKAIKSIQLILHSNSLSLEKSNAKNETALPKVLTGLQAQIIDLRYQKNYSFNIIAKELDISIKEAQKEFMTAYRFTQNNLEPELS